MLFPASAINFSGVTLIFFGAAKEVDAKRSGNARSITNSFFTMD